MSKITVTSSGGEWVVHLDGYWIMSFWRKSKAYELAHHLRRALNKE